MMHHIAIQHTIEQIPTPSSSLLKTWTKKVLAHQNIHQAEITIRIVSTTEMSELNQQYRHKSGPTNVLSFPYQTHHQRTIERFLLGDIVICAEVVNQEATAQHRQAHWAHMVVHGMLHLIGYDHEIPDEATIMENLEINIMQQLGFANPYESGENCS